MSIVRTQDRVDLRRYAIVDEAMQREAAARLDAWTAGPSGSVIDGHRHCSPSR